MYSCLLFEILQFLCNSEDVPTGTHLRLIQVYKNEIQKEEDDLIDFPA